jgi:hypothetical protein
MPADPAAVVVGIREHLLAAAGPRGEAKIGMVVAPAGSMRSQTSGVSASAVPPALLSAATMRCRTSLGRYCQTIECNSTVVTPAGRTASRASTQSAASACSTRVPWRGT